MNSDHHHHHHSPPFSPRCELHPFEAFTAFCPACLADRLHSLNSHARHSTSALNPSNLSTHSALRRCNSSLSSLFYDRNKPVDDDKPPAKESHVAGGLWLAATSLTKKLHRWRRRRRTNGRRTAGAQALPENSVDIKTSSCVTVDSSSLPRKIETRSLDIEEGAALPRREHVLGNEDDEVEPSNVRLARVTTIRDFDEVGELVLGNDDSLDGLSEKHGIVRQTAVEDGSEQTSECCPCSSSHGYSLNRTSSVGEPFVELRPVSDARTSPVAGTESFLEHTRVLLDRSSSVGELGSVSNARVSATVGTELDRSSSVTELRSVSDAPVSPAVGTESFRAEHGVFLDRSSSVRELRTLSNARVSPTVDAESFRAKGEGLLDRELSDWRSRSLRDDFFGTFESVCREFSKGANKNRKSKRWSRTWNIWELLQRKKGANSVGDRPAPGSCTELRARDIDVLSYRHSFSSTLGHGSIKRGDWGIDIGHGAKRRGEFGLDRARSSRYSPSPGHGDTGMLRFYLTPVRNGWRNGGGTSNGQQISSQYFAKSVVRLY